MGKCFNFIRARNCKYMIFVKIKGSKVPLLHSRFTIEFIKCISLTCEYFATFGGVVFGGVSAGWNDTVLFGSYSLRGTPGYKGAVGVIQRFAMFCLRDFGTVARNPIVWLP